MHWVEFSYNEYAAYVFRWAILRPLDVRVSNRAVAYEDGRAWFIRS